MRITIDTEDKGSVNIDTGDKGNDKPGLFESTTDIPVTDAGGAPIQEIERLRNTMMTTEVGTLSASPSLQEREAQLPLNPLRAGAAAAYQNPANLIRQAAGYEGMSAAQDQSIAAIDGGTAQMAADNETSEAPAPEQPSSKGAKRDKKR